MGKLKAICTALTIFILSPANAAWSGKYLLLYLMTTNPNLPANVIVLGTFDNLDDCKDAASAPNPLLWVRQAILVQQSLVFFIAFPSTEARMSHIPTTNGVRSAFRC